MPVAGRGARLQNRRWLRNLDQNDDGRRRGDWDRRVQDDAERAMVLVIGSRMDMGHLYKWNQDEQGHADENHSRKSTWLYGAMIGEPCLIRLEQLTLSLKDTQCWMSNPRIGLSLG